MSYNDVKQLTKMMLVVASGNNPGVPEAIFTGKVVEHARKMEDVYDKEQLQQLILDIYSSATDPIVMKDMNLWPVSYMPYNINNARLDVKVDKLLKRCGFKKTEADLEADRKAAEANKPDYVFHPRMDTCPKCKASWLGKPIPPEEQQYHSPPYFYSRLINHCEPSQDRITHYICPDCRFKYVRQIIEPYMQDPSLQENQLLEESQILDQIHNQMGNVEALDIEGLKGIVGNVLAASTTSSTSSTNTTNKKK